MSPQRRDSHAPPITLEDVLGLVRASRPEDWLRLGDWLVLKSNLRIRIQRVPQDCDFDAPWILQQPDFVPNLFHYTLYYCCSPIAEIEMVQVRPGLEMPLPRRASAGLLIDPRPLHLAWLVNDGLEELKSYTRAANIALPALAARESTGAYVSIRGRLSSIYLIPISLITRLWQLLRN